MANPDLGYITKTPAYLRAWERWERENPPDCGVVRHAAPPDARATRMLQEQRLEQLRNQR